MSAATFYDDVLPYATRAARALGVPVSGVLAQWALESTKGTSVAARTKNNLAGLMVATATGQTPRSYPSLTAFTEAYIGNLNRSIYDAVRNTATFEAFVKALADSPWDVDHYVGLLPNRKPRTGVPRGQALRETYQRDGLARFDTATGTSPGTGSGAGSSTTTGPGSATPAGAGAGAVIVDANNDSGSIERRPARSAITSTTDPLSVLSVPLLTNLPDLIIQARLSLSTTQVSQIALKIADPDYRMIDQAIFEVGATKVLLGDWQFRVSVVETGANKAGTGELDITARSDLAQNLRHKPYDQPATFNDKSPTQALAIACTYIVGEDGPQRIRPNIGVAGVNLAEPADGNSTHSESWWDAAARWAREEGFWIFDADNVLYFGRPSWLADHLPSLTLTWTGTPDGVLMTRPRVRATEDGEDPNAITKTVTLLMHPAAAVHTRPGMAAYIGGIGPDSGLYIVTNVEGDFRTRQPWTVTCTTIRDPTPQNQSDDFGGGFTPDTPTDAGSTTPPAAAAPALPTSAAPGVATQATKARAAIRSAGATSTEAAGFASRGGSSFNPQGIIVHHTVGLYSSVEHMSDILIKGVTHPDGKRVPGPLCNAGLRPDGTVVLIAAGTANHGGKGDVTVLENVKRGVAPTKLATINGPDGSERNSSWYGIECEHTGSKSRPWPSVQVETLIAFCAELCRQYGWSANAVVGHSEWTKRKVDPVYTNGLPSMSWLRQQIAARL